MRISKMLLDVNRIKILQARKQLTQGQLAELAGVTQAWMSQLMKNGRCSIITAGKIAAALDVDVEEIISEVL